MERLRSNNRADRRRVGYLASLGIVLVGLSAHQRPSLIWNRTRSAPTGLYEVGPPFSLRVGQFVATAIPSAWERLATERGYVEPGVPLVKRIAALRGDTVCATSAGLAINGRFVVKRLRVDAHGRAMPWSKRCRRLMAGEMLLLNAAHADSFDGRYFGPIPVADAVGSLQLIMEW